MKETTAAITDNPAEIQNANLKLDMTAGAIIFGKKVLLTNKLCVATGSVCITFTGIRDFIGLYPKKAENKAAVGGIEEI